MTQSTDSLPPRTPRPFKPQRAAFRVALVVFFAWVGVLAWMYVRTRGVRAPVKPAGPTLVLPASQSE